MVEFASNGFEIAGGETEARCAVAADDEACTYNQRGNRLAPIKEHYMIFRAIERGVPRQRRQLLSGIHVDVAELLKDKPVGINGFQKLRKMKPIRQLEVVITMSLSVSVKRRSTGPCYLEF